MHHAECTVPVDNAVLELFVVGPPLVIYYLTAVPAWLCVKANKLSLKSKTKHEGAITPTCTTSGYRSKLHIQYLGIQEAVSFH